MIDNLEEFKKVCEEVSTNLSKINENYKQNKWEMDFIWEEYTSMNKPANIKKIDCCDEFLANTRDDGFVLIDGAICVGGCCGGHCCVLTELKYCPYCGAEIKFEERDV